MTDQRMTLPPESMRADRNVARLGVAASLAALFSAAACCVLPLALGAIGIGAGGLAVLVPLHWPLTLAAGAAVSIGWLLDVRRRRACSSGGCASDAQDRAAVIMLSLATLVVAVSALWGYIEQPLMRALGGA
ncbi:hypothetical protein [Allosphingosinicella sp.]|uniref:hypothetical protein n=1 Tax=Allosphingosinicella sp. TaxID=2823234 RepID=UPI002FC2724D